MAPETETKQRWHVLSLDVWGNAKEGYDINDYFSAGWLPDDADLSSDQTILRALKDERVFAPHVQARHLHFDHSAEGYISIERKRDGRPLIHLRLEDKA
jgi:hypothetical protein